MSAGLSSRRRDGKDIRGRQNMLGNTRTQGRAILKALSDPSDDLWEDEDEDEEKDYDSGLGSSSGSGSEGRRMAANEIARRKKHLKMSSRLIRRQSRVVDVLGSSKDPFGAMPDAIRGSDLLVYHWNHVLAHSGVAGPRKDWFPFALQHPILFQATLFVSAASYDTMNGRRMPMLFLTHRGEVIRGISSRLEDPKLAATDATIGAVAMIYMVDSMRQSKDIALTHLEGLQQLIFARGGMALLDSRVQVMIKLVDLLGSAYLRTPPHFQDSRFENVTSAHIYGHASASTEMHAQAFAARLAAFTGDSDTADSCAIVYWGLRNLTLILGSNRTKWHEEIDFSTRVEFLEREVSGLMEKLKGKQNGQPRQSQASAAKGKAGGATATGNTATAEGKYTDSLIFSLFYTATRIYLHLTLHQLNTSLPLYPLMAKILEESLSVSDARLKTLLGTFPDLMLWVLFLGGNAAPWGRKGWFAKTVARVLLVKKVEEKKGVEAAADAFLWPEGRVNYNPAPGEGILEVGVATDS